MADDKRFYWLKLKRDFFKRHDISVIESLPNGKDYVLFYLKLLCESIDHDGNLRFSDHVPYNEEMLSAITNTNVDIVRSAIKIFTELRMMEILDDGTYYMSEVHKMLGSAADNDNANRQRRFRERQKELALQDRYDCVTKNNESKSIEYRDIELENRDIPPYNPPKGEADAEKKTVETSHGKTVDTQGKTLETQFDRFWKVYPKHVGKDAARKAFKRVVEKRSVSVETLIAAVEKQKSWQQWTKDNGQYIPNASTWLNQARWEDEQYSNMDAVRKQYTTKGSFFDDD